MHTTSVDSTRVRLSFPEPRFALDETFPRDTIQSDSRTQSTTSHDSGQGRRGTQVPLQREVLQTHSVSYRSPRSGISNARDYLSGQSSSPTVRVAAHKQWNSPRPARAPPSLMETPSPSTGHVESTPPSISNIPVVQGIPLVSLRQTLPERLRSVFLFELFNAVQSECFDTVYNTTDNFVIAAPTGSGKTAILELAICKLALERGNENYKIVYQAPTKALCSERARDWEAKFSHMSLKCAELTGDTSQSEMRRVGDASIIVTTPEKWDSITRKWHDHRRLLQMVELFLIDEVHILKNVRGATLEAVVSRMKTIGANVRFVALSATVPNPDDIAIWLGRNHTNQQLPAHRETFGEEFRPVKLKKFVYGYENSGNDFVFEKYLDSKLPVQLSKHSRGKPVLVFCFTRKSCEKTAALLAEYISERSENERLWPTPSKRIPVISRELQEVVPFGVAFHHAGLDAQDRNSVKQHYLKGDLSIICCTSTLAVGVNLPCHTAVLKGTIGFSDEKAQELSGLEVMQMLGRAGRPQFDDSATAIILTRACNKARYERMVLGQKTLESTLHLNLIEHLDSEVCLGTISDLPSAKTWLSGTFLSIRLRRNPGHYRLTGGTSNPSQIDEKLEEICERDVRLLQKTELVTDGSKFSCTNYGRAMSRYMVEFETMKRLLEIPRGVRMEQLIVIISQVEEFREFRFKPAERALFREVNQSPLIVYPVKETVNQTWHKVCLMIQAHLGHVQYLNTGEGPKLRRQLLIEKKLIFERLQRLVRAVIDCKGHDRDAAGVKTALELVRSLSAESWEGRVTQLTQIPNIGPAGMKKLAGKGIRTVQQLAEMDADEIERLMSRQAPFGRKIKDELEKFPHLSLDVALTSHELRPGHKEEPVIVNASATLRYLNRRSAPNWRGKMPLVTFAAESNDGTLLYFWRGNMRKVDKNDGLELKFTTGLSTACDCVICHFSCEEIVGTAVTQVLKHNLPTSVFPTAATTSPFIRDAKDASLDYMSNDGLEDSDSVEAAEKALAFASSYTRDVEPTTVGASEGYPLVEDYLEVLSPQWERVNWRNEARPEADDGTEEIYDQSFDDEPVKLPNSKWRCNHACSGDARTKAGKLCTHKCCKEGLERLRKKPQPKPKKRKEDEMVVADTIEAAPAYSTPSSTLPSKIYTAPEPKRLKQMLSEPKALSNATHSNTKYPWRKTNLDETEIDCIDLSTVDDEPKGHGGSSHPSFFDSDFDMFSSQITSSPQSHLTVRQFGNTGFHRNTQNFLAATDVPKAGRGFVQVPPVKLAQKTMAFSRSTTGDYLDDLADEDLMNEFLFTTDASAAESPFKSGATDEVLFQSISRKSGEGYGDELEQLTAVNLPATEMAEGGSLTLEDSYSLAPRSPKGVQEFEISPSSSSSTSRPSTVSAGVSDSEIHGKPALPDPVVSRPREEEPAWVSEFDPELVDLFQGFVSFV